MKNKLFSAFLCCMLLISSICGLYASAQSEQDTVGQAQAFIDGIVASRSASSIQTWIDGELTENAGITSEWYILALAQSGMYDFTSYEQALFDYLVANEVRSASTRLKYALVLTAIGSNDEYVSAVFDEAIGQQGIMSWVYGLHLLNNGYKSAQYSIDEVKSTILSFQHGDGGWSVTGETGDSDVTAMVVQSLAPYYAVEDTTKAAIDNALVFLTEKQLESGGYTSYGIENPESASQVVIALSALGIDCMTDSRFIKNGNSLFDAISSYRLSDGSFCHTASGNTNENAASQVFLAMTAYIRMLQGKSSLYLLDSRSFGDFETPLTPPAETLPSSQPESEPTITDTAPESNETASQEKTENYKIWACLLIVALGVTGAFVLYFLKKRHFKNYIAVAVVTVAAIIFILVTDFRSADDYYNGKDAVKEDPIGSVSLTIRCDTIADQSDSDHIPSDGIILEVTEFEIEEGDSVYDILIEASRKYGIPIENNGNSELVYIVGINNLYEYDYGDLSGWVYRVNGEQSSVGCGEYILSDGDDIEWLYTCSLGNDLK